MMRHQNCCKKLLFTAALAIAALGVTTPACSQPPPPMRADLNLSPEQQQKLREHARETREKTEVIRRDMWAARSELWRQFRSYHLDEKAARNAAKKINSCHLRLLNSYLESQVGLRNILTKDQFQKLSRAVGGRDRDRPRQGFEGRPRMPEPGGESLGDVSHLNLSPAQQEKIRKLYEENSRVMEDLMKKQMDDFRALESLYLNYNLDQKRAKQLIKHLNDIHMKIQEASIKRQIEIRKILIEEQFNALKPKVRPPVEGMPGFGKGERIRRGQPDR